MVSSFHAILQICAIILSTNLVLAQYTTTINLGSCVNFAVQAGTSANFNGVVTQVTVGNVGVSPGTSITGDYVLGTGSTEDNSQAAMQCAADEGTAYLQAQAAVCPAANNLASPDLAGVTLGPGVYCSSSMEITASSLTLDGQGNSASVWVFQTASTVTTATSTSIILINGAQASNVFWEVGTAATIGISSAFVGTILAGTAINLSSGSTLLGRALAQTAVTCQSGNTITAPSSSTQVSSQPSSQPSGQPSSKPISSSPSIRPSSLPTLAPLPVGSSFYPSSGPTILPTAVPSSVPSSFAPTKIPSQGPSRIPTVRPSFNPSSTATSRPSQIPSQSVSSSPSVVTSAIPSSGSSISPSVISSVSPTRIITSTPSATTTYVPSGVSTNRYASAINLGSCVNFAVQAGTSANFNGVATLIPIGNVGVSPGTSITGAYVLGSGSTEDNSQAAMQCAADQATAYLQAQAAVCPAANNLASPDLAGVTLGPGVYCSGFMEITASSLTLDGQGNSTSVWIFQTATTLTTATSTSLILINGAQASNVFWEVGTAATIGAGATFAGTILAGTAINLDSGASLLGRALSMTAVTCASGNTIKSPSSIVIVYPTSSPNPADVSVTDTTTSSSSSGGLSKGAIAGIVIGSVVGAMLICGLIFWFVAGGKSFGLGYSSPESHATGDVVMTKV